MKKLKQVKDGNSILLLVEDKNEYKLIKLNNYRFVASYGIFNNYKQAFQAFANLRLKF